MLPLEYLVFAVDNLGNNCHGVGKESIEKQESFIWNTEEISSVSIPLPDKPIEEASDSLEDEYCLWDKILHVLDQEIEGVRITFREVDCVTTDEERSWQAGGFTGSKRVVPIHDVYLFFSPTYFWVQREEEIHFKGGIWVNNRWEHINLNIRGVEPFQDKRVRQVLMLGIDW